MWFEIFFFRTIIAIDSRAIASVREPESTPRG